MKKRIYLTLLPLLSLALTTSVTLADFKPGRVRPGIVSDMRTVDASGIFERLPGARVEMNFQDGKKKPVSFTLKLKGQAPKVLPIVNTTTSNCGNQYVAQDNAPRSGQMRLELIDYSEIKCRLFVTNKWHLSVQHKSGESASLWKLEGQPEFLVRTQLTQ
jgi:hypothetical protein